MNRRGEEERQYHRRLLRQLVSQHCRRVNMSQEERVDRPVPLPRKFIPSSRIPPMIIK